MVYSALLWQRWLLTPSGCRCWSRRPGLRGLGLRGPPRAPREVSAALVSHIDDVIVCDLKVSPSHSGTEMDLTPGSPLVLTHRITLVPSLGSGSCGCGSDLAALRGRLERLEREVSTLREKCGGAEGGCCSSKESQGRRD